MPGPPASEVPESLLKMQIHEPHSRPTEAEFPVVEPMHLHPFTSSPDGLVQEQVWEAPYSASLGLSHGVTQDLYFAGAPPVHILI